MDPGLSESENSPSTEPTRFEAQKAAPTEPVTGSLLDCAIAATDSTDHRAAQLLQQFLKETDATRAIACWLGNQSVRDGQQLVRLLNRDVARIDQLVNSQLNAILHAPAFQRLEASWRGLVYLTEQAAGEEEGPLKVKVLHATWRELERDFERATEFDQSQLFQKIYEQEFGTAGGEPYGLLIGDYEVHPQPTATHPHVDLDVLSGISQVAAAAFCPFIANTHPSFLGLDDFSGIQQPLDFSETFEQVEWIKWRAMRQREEARFVGLTLPHILMRTPYEDEGTRIDQFCFREQTDRREDYLWGGAAFAYGAVVLRAFARAGWLADIRGVRRGLDGGGLVTGLENHSFSTDLSGLALKSSTDVMITDEREKKLADLGFLPLCHCQDTQYAAFYSSQSIQKPQVFDESVATINSQISAMLSYMLCVSRFGHYIKVLGREKIGSFQEAADFERFLEDWIIQFVTSDDEAGPDVKARFPLREASVNVRSNPGKPGSFQCHLHLVPHYELDQLQARVSLVAELTPAART
ncbi:MAG TPA: type VI secretion system contractile sheath large subunit [Planctomycetaceae bacterium]|nr:type VI secretion system contractile sheath large subunit [Planctomycetaceae bacterium]|tara:strand:+ start:26620 stop:28191 length:1572 start_codon:yes stop_codon:yes gene_type:complete